MVAGKRLAFVVVVALVVAWLGACSKKEGALPSRLTMRAAVAGYQGKDASEATLVGALGKPTLAVATGKQSVWYYEVSEGGAVKVALTKRGDNWHVDDLDTLTAADFESVRARK